MIVGETRRRRAVAPYRNQPVAVVVEVGNIFRATRLASQPPPCIEAGGRHGAITAAIVEPVIGERLACTSRRMRSHDQSSGRVVAVALYAVVYDAPGRVVVVVPLEQGSARTQQPSPERATVDHVGADLFD